MLREEETRAHRLFTVLLNSSWKMPTPSIAAEVLSMSLSRVAKPCKRARYREKARERCTRQPSKPVTALLEPS